MKTKKELHDERLARIKTAFALGKPDRVPFYHWGDVYIAKHNNLTIADYLSDGKRACELGLKAHEELGGEIDLTSGVTIGDMSLLGTIWLSKVKRSGIELPPESIWQIQEQELMAREDYDTIINGGWMPFYMNYLKERLGLDLAAMFAPPPPESFGNPQMLQAFRDAGYPIGELGGGSAVLPYEYFCGGRSLPQFMKDLVQIPDKVQAAMDVVLEANVNGIRQAMKMTDMSTYISHMFGGWRSASEFVSPKLWNRFVWPYYRKLAETIIEEGGYVVMHMDSNWERDLDYFLELPKAKTCFESDAATNIFKIKEKLDGHACIRGDVPPAMLAIGTPEEVYDYSIRLIKEMGPAGFILCSGCTIPPNAEFGNVKAMVSAVSGK